MTVTALPVTADNARHYIITYARTSDDVLVAVYGQEQEVIERAREMGFTVAGSTRDQGISGATTISQRAGLTAAIQAIQAPGCAGLIVKHLDRIARKEPIMLETIEHIWDLDRDIYCCTYGQIPRGPIGRKLCTAVAQDADAEAARIVERLHNGRRRAADMNLYIGGTRLHRRYGDQLINGRYQPIPEEQAAIHLMIQLRQQGYGWRTIARRLDEQGIPTVEGRPWTHNAVKAIVRRGPSKLHLSPPQGIAPQGVHRTQQSFTRVHGAWG